MISIYFKNPMQDVKSPIKNAFNISYNQKSKELFTASFSLPINDRWVDKLEQLDFIEVFDDGKRVELFIIVESRETFGNGVPVIQYDLSCIHITGIFRTAWSNCRNLSVYVCKKRIFDQVSSHLHRDTFLITIYRSRFVWIFGIPCVFRTWKKSSCRSTFHFHTGNSSYYNDDGGCDQWTAR